MMRNPDLVAVFTLDEEKLYGGGVPFIICKNKKERDLFVMDMCRIIGATAHEIGEHVFVIKR